MLAQDDGPPPGEPLVLWQPPPGDPGKAVEVDPVLCRWLRPHQRDGVQFLFECVMGMRQKHGLGALRPLLQCSLPACTVYGP